MRENTAAMLTTFNDVDMSAVIKLRSEYRYCSRSATAGWASWASSRKACLQALREIPAVNAEIDGDEIVDKNYYHIGDATGPTGVSSPVGEKPDRMSLAEIESQITDLGEAGATGKLVSRIQGGTFTITERGRLRLADVYPVWNAPQSGILGMHPIEERPVAATAKSWPVR